jgi:hypothetical protein
MSASTLSLSYDNPSAHTIHPRPRDGKAQQSPPGAPRSPVAERDQRQQFVTDVRGSHGGHLGVVVGGRDLDDVRAADS